MNREIKFRSFMEDANADWEDEESPDRYEMIYDFAFEEYNTVNDMLRLTENLMQYTGLKDKNGVEIYEGDIVKWGHANTRSSESFHRIAKVELFPSLQFRILWYYDTRKECKKETDNNVFEFGRFSYQETDKHLEVIGNIYENPELLQ